MLQNDDIDLLDRKSLASRVANEIDKLSSDESFSFGILAPWGKGKT